jgi:5-methylcytosine-specific restriction protein A
VGQIHSKHPEVIELSRLLNRLPIFDIKPDEVKFRNPNGVGLKLSNFLALDDSYSGKGMERFSKLDQAVFQEFKNDLSRLNRIAQQIRQIADDPLLPNELYLIQEKDNGETISVSEGAVIYKLHRFRERDSRIIDIKKKIEFEKYGALLCEACTFDFHETYGELGFKFIECHHKIPIAEFNAQTRTTLNDLSLVCSNCHRMLHRKIDTMSVEQLKHLLAG